MLSLILATFLMKIVQNYGKFAFVRLDAKYKIKYDRYKDKKTGEWRWNSRISIYDSLLLLPKSLDSLAKSFKVSTQKGMFPYKFLTDKTSLAGEVPSIEHFPHPNAKTQPDKYMEYENLYNKYKSNFKNNWNHGENLKIKVTGS